MCQQCVVAHEPSLAYACVGCISNQQPDWTWQVSAAGHTVCVCVGCVLGWGPGVRTALRSGGKHACTAISRPKWPCTGHGQTVHTPLS